MSPTGEVGTSRSAWAWAWALALALAVLSSISLTPSAEAQIYEHINRNGVVEFSHQPRGRGWSLVAFPARTARRYSAPPRTMATTRAAGSARASSFERVLREAARLYQLPVAFLRAVMHVESHFDPRVVSVDGAMGLMQLMPFTARRMGVLDPYDPKQNILGGARFLRILANQWQGDLVLTIASYNAGPGAVAKHGGIPPYRETQRYVRRVLGFYEAYRAASGAAVPVDT